MAFGFAGAAAGSSDALQQLLAERRAAFLQQQQLAMQQEQQQRLKEQFEATMAGQAEDRAFRARDFEADQADRVSQRERQGRMDERQLRLDDVAAGDRRQVENQRGVRRMIGDFLVQRGSKPLDPGSRQTLQGMAVQEDVDLPEGVTEDPQADATRAGMIAEAQAKAAAKYRAPSAASVDQDWVIRNGQPTPIRKGTAQPGDTPYEKSSGGRGVLSGDVNRIAELRTSLDDLTTLRQTIAAPGETGGTGTMAQIGAALPNVVTNLTGLGVSAKQKRAVIDRVKQVIGKALEGGVLRKEDEYKYTKILPTIGDKDAVVLTKLNGLETAITQRLEQTIEALEQAGYNVGGFRGGRPNSGSTTQTDADALLDELLGGGR